ncbi:hypothetical protein CsSME_00040640 [Camellia sinensis var. sinensis]
MKAIIAGVNQDDLIPQVFLQDELSTLAKKAFNLLQPRWSDIVEYEGSEKAVLNRGAFRCAILFQTLDIVAENPEKFTILALATGSNVTLLADQCTHKKEEKSGTESKPSRLKSFKKLAIAFLIDSYHTNESLVDELKEALADVEDKLEFIASEQGAIELVSLTEAEMCQDKIGFDDVRKHTCK